MERLERALAGALIVLLTGSGGTAHAQKSLEYGISAGVDVSEGDYGLPGETTMVYLPVTMRLARGDWSARLTLAHLQVTGPAGGTTFGGGSRARQSGVGDVVLGVTWSRELSLAGTNWLDLSARVKVPTADEDRGLGTGAFDATIEVEVLRSIGRWTPFASAGYRFLGDAPRVSLANGFIASVGLDRRLGARLNAGALVDYREPAARRSDDVLELVPYLSWRAGGGITLTGYATLGLAAGSPDRGFGLQIGFRSDQ